MERLGNSITMLTMMGLTWIFGYFLLIPINETYEEVLQWLFTAFNVFQVSTLPFNAVNAQCFRGLTLRVKTVVINSITIGYKYLKLNINISGYVNNIIIEFITSQNWI